MGGGASVDTLPEAVNLDTVQSICGNNHKYCRVVFEALQDETGSVSNTTLGEYLNLNVVVSELCDKFQNAAGQDATISDPEVAIPKSAVAAIAKEMGYELGQEGEANLPTSVTFKEYLPVMFHKARMKSLSKEIRASFSVFDVNGDGFITVEEMKEAMHLLGEDVTMEEAAAMIGDADVNADGKIDIHEYGMKMTRDALPEELDLPAFLAYFGSTASKELFEALKDSSTGTVKKERLLNYERVLANVHNFRKEFTAAVAANGAESITADQAMLLINSWGYDVPLQELGEGTQPVQFKIFLKVLFEKAKPSRTHVETVDTFRTFDVDGDGFVTAQELQKGLSMIGDEITVEEAQEMVKDADVDGDGRLNYIEYKEKLGMAATSNSGKEEIE